MPATKVNINGINELDLNLAGTVTATTAAGVTTITQSGVSGTVLETNGTPNGSQALLNLKNGVGTKVTDDGAGGITFDNVTVLIGYIIGTGSTGSSIGPLLIAPRAGSIAKCVIVTKNSDPSTALTFRILKNGVNVFTVNPTVAAGTATGTITTSTSLTTVPLPVVANDVFQIDILSGTSTWQFTAQLESS